MVEEWRPIKNSRGYEVSSHGRVRSVPRIVQLSNRVCRYKGKIISPTKNQHGHLKLFITNTEGKRVLRYVHHLVAEAFIGNRTHEYVCHNDGNTLNNHVSNLRYDTPKGNSLDTMPHATRAMRDWHPSAKLSESDVFRVRDLMDSGVTQKQIAAMFEVSRTTISAISTGRSWNESKKAMFGVHPSDEPTVFYGRTA